MVIIGEGTLKRKAGECDSDDALADIGTLEAAKQQFDNCIKNYMNSEQSDLNLYQLPSFSDLTKW